MRNPHEMRARLFITYVLFMFGWIWMLYPLFEGASALASSGATYLTPKTVLILISAKNYCYQNSQAYSILNLV